MRETILTLWLVVPLTCVLGAATGCASILTGGSAETISVTSEPPGASVKVLPTGETGATPVNLELSKKNSYVLRVRKECYEEERPEIRNPVHPLMFGNLILGGVVGMIVDVSTGGGFNLEPDEIDLTLRPVPGCVVGGIVSSSDEAENTTGESAGASDEH